MTRNGKILVAAVALLLVSGAALAQDEKPKPGPEHEKLGYFTGKWTSEGEIKPNPFIPEGKMTSTDDCKWFEGGFSVVCHSTGNGPMGAMKGIGIMGYNADDKVYTYFGVDNTPMAMTTVPRGTVNGSTWTFTDESMMDGHMVKSRYVIEELSKSSYTFKWQMLEDGKWTTVMEGKTTKAS